MSRMNKYQITNQHDLRCAFWQEHKDAGCVNVTRRKIKNYSGNGTMHNTDTRVAWCDWIDGMCKQGAISQELAHRATLD